LYVVYVTEADEDRADALFHALADRTRRDIMRRVLAGEHSVSALAAKYGVSFAAVQKHVAVLEKAGLLIKRRSGREQLASGDWRRCGGRRPIRRPWSTTTSSPVAA
jgi:DNA-binding transcriptional ArsR family regulator